MNALAKATIDVGAQFDFRTIMSSPSASVPAMPLPMIDGAPTFVQIVLINESREADVYFVPVEKMHFDEWEALTVMHNTFKAPYVDTRWKKSESSSFIKYEELLRFLLFDDLEFEFATKSSWEKYRYGFDVAVTGRHLVTNFFILQDTDCTWW